MRVSKKISKKSRFEISFVKMQNLGNDFILVDLIAPGKDELEKLKRVFRKGDVAKKLCDRRFGIGADGILLMSRGTRSTRGSVGSIGSIGSTGARGGFVTRDADGLRMEILNSDGSVAMMCGNGLGCFGLYAFQAGHVSTPSFKVMTRSGERSPEILFDKSRSSNKAGALNKGGVPVVRIDMGRPILVPSKIPFRGKAEEIDGLEVKVGKEKFEASVVSMGNPHLIIWSSRTDAEQVSRLGPILENHPLFPEKTNVHFVSRKTNAYLVQGVWERGAGRTLACGTGACAVAVAAIRKGFVKRDVTIEQPGGLQHVVWSSDERVYLDTSPRVVYRGTAILEEAFSR
jgi:diaminopimelate epimerase